MESKMKRWALLLSLGCLAFDASAVHADQLDDIKKKGVLVCGVLGNYTPFSAPDPTSREIVGYDVDFCNAIAKALGVKPELKQVSTDARIPELAQSRVDIITAVFGYTRTRAEQVDYSDTYYVTRIMVMVPESSPIKTLSELAGKKVSAIAGSTQERYVRDLVPTVSTVTYQDPSTTFLALAQGRVDAETASELALLQLQTASPGQYRLLKEVVALEKWGIGIRKNEPALKAFVSALLQKMEASGEMEATFAKWFGDATPFKLKRGFKVGPIGDPVLNPGI